LGVEMNMNSSGYTLYIFQELMPTKESISSLLKKDGPFSNKTVKLYIKQLLMGLVFLHSKNIIHLDIKGSLPTTVMATILLHIG
jgi:mitogen-activated protein kinase kinase kinase